MVFKEAKKCIQNHETDMVEVGCASSSAWQLDSSPLAVGLGFMSLGFVLIFSLFPPV